jgi:hypothetical protein
MSKSSFNLTLKFNLNFFKFSLLLIKGLKIFALSFFFSPCINLSPLILNVVYSLTSLSTLCFTFKEFSFNFEQILIEIINFPFFL